MSDFNDELYAARKEFYEDMLENLMAAAQHSKEDRDAFDNAIVDFHDRYF